MAEHTVTVDGVSYHTLLDGPGGAPVVLLTHALMSNHRMWDSTVSALHQANYRTLRFDHIGHNKTPAPSDSNRSYSTEDITHHMHHIVQTATGQTHIKAVLGCSIGGVLALRYGMLYPTEVQSVISLCPPGIKSLDVSKPLWSQRIEQFEMDVQDGSDSLCQMTVKRWMPGNRSHDKAVRAAALEHVRTCTLEGYKILADAIRGYDYDSKEELEKLRDVRVLMVAGGKDGAVEADLLKDVALRIPPKGAKFQLMEDTGHLPPMHHAEDFEKLMLSFLK